MPDIWRHAIASETAPCTEADDCPCAGDPDAHAQRTVECPECGGPSSPRAVDTWGHCRACRTADSRLKSPLRW
jgi:ribosomal protein L40E